MLAFIVSALLCAIFLGCSEDNSLQDKTKNVASCEGCHTNYDHLQKVYSPDTSLPAGGCGGEAPHYEPYDRVYLGGEGYKAFKRSSHYKIGCVGCHNGVDGTSDKNVAHSGNFVPHPSVLASEKCGKCHKEIVDIFPTSIHNGYGQMRKVAVRSGYSSYKDFDKLPESHKEGYKKNCATCHANCGECHIIRPKAGGGGLANGHNFVKTPDMIKTCVVCHSSRGGHAFLGVGTGTKPDVHQTKGMVCTSCHTGAEMHGDGTIPEHRYAYSKMPNCESCHPNLETKNRYHQFHYDSLSCHVCHSQRYNNCGSCHIRGLGARIASYLDFKIALNPIPDVKSRFKFVTVRRTLAAPDNWIEYGIPQYSNFDALPTYNFATPHNILRWTERTKVEEGAKCYANCHIRKSGDSLINARWYLFEKDLLEWEKKATTKITVDKALPKEWFN
ncbi:MAG: hypothetical protein N2517_05315 [Ignavibacteria bacterium]|nr:hypothetical protein [Ignavibacteria bacterium]